MATHYDIQGPARYCTATGRPLSVGDRYYGVLADEDGKFVRRDFAADVWSGPPAGCVAFWAGRIPHSGRPKKPTFNEDLLADCFAHLNDASQPDRVNFRYVVALLLMRRKRLKFEDVRRGPGGENLLVVRDAKTGTRHEVADPRLDEAEITAVQDEVFRVLGWE